MTDSGASQEGAVPQWELPDRLRRALRFAGVSRAEIADHLGVSLNTVNNWLGEKTKIRYAFVVLWAQKTGVSLDWLLDDDTIHLGDDSIHPDDEHVEDEPHSPGSP
jgi:transcriptional regulator with XRE-family HTH domain